jgi:glutamine cyclotransferase
MQQHISQNIDAVANGIAYNHVNNRLYVTGKLWDTLYEIDFNTLQR